MLSLSSKNKGVLKVLIENKGDLWVDGRNLVKYVPNKWQKKRVDYSLPFTYQTGKAWNQRGMTRTVIKW